MREYAEKLLTEVVVDENGCWLLPNRKLLPKGYVPVKIGGSTAPQRRTTAHVIVYEYYAGPVPEGLVLDHLCRNRACCRWDHCEPVTNRENLLRGDTIVAANAAKTHCYLGHEFTPENTYVYRGKRSCRTCQRKRATSRKM